MKLQVAMVVGVGVALLACGAPEPAPDETQGASFMPGLGATGGILVRPPVPPPPPPPPPPFCDAAGRTVAATNFCTPDGSYPLNAWNDPVSNARALCFSSWDSISAHPFVPDFSGCVYQRYSNLFSSAFGYPFYLPQYCSRSCYQD